MIEITDDAYQLLFETLSSNLHISTEYGSPPIFYWYRTMIEETKRIECSPNKRCGEFKYKLGHDLGIAYVMCQYVGKERVLIVTDYDINRGVLFSWKTHPNDCGIISQNGNVIPNNAPRVTSAHINSISYVRPFRTYRLDNGNMVYAVQSDNHLYSLADKGKNLVINKWFNYFSFPIKQEIEGLHIIGYGSCQGITYYIDDTLKLHHGAEIAHLQRRKIESLERTKIRLTEQQFCGLISECVRKILREIALI